MEPSFSWVLKPKWVKDMAAYRNASSHSNDELSPAPTWCHFMLERPRGGDEDVREDLARLPSVVPVLLGRQAIDPDCAPEEEEGKWILAWGDKLFTISRSVLAPSLGQMNGSCGDRGSHSHLKRMRERHIAGDLMGTYFDSYCSSIKATAAKRPYPPSNGRDSRTQEDNQTWQFLTVCFDPSSSARGAFEGHTKRPWTGKKYHTNSFFSSEHSSPSVLAEEVSLFFQINNNAEPILSQQRYSNAGYLHAVLPTKLKLPFAMNLQASWLLSVDRQEVQSLTENAWNHCLISQVSVQSAE